MARRLSLAVALLLVVPVVSLAEEIGVGVLSFDNLFPGINFLNVTNFTGDPAVSGNADPVDFPVFDPLTFLTVSINVMMDDGSASLIMFDQIGSGSLDPTVDATQALVFADTANVLSATFTAMLSQTTFLLFDGSTFVADSPSLSVTLSEPSGDPLMAGSDLAPIIVSGHIASSSVPEPSSLLLLGTGLLGFIGLNFRSRRA